MLNTYTISVGKSLDIPRRCGLPSTVLGNVLIDFCEWGRVTTYRTCGCHSVAKLHDYLRGRKYRLLENNSVAWTRLLLQKKRFSVYDTVVL